MGAAIAANDNDVVVPSSSTKNKGAYISTSVALKGACFGVFADGAGCSGSAPWGTRTAEALVDSIVAGKVIAYLQADCCIVIITIPSWIGIHVIIASPPSRTYQPEQQRVAQQRQQQNNGLNNLIDSYVPDP
jgi:hypothetical protein